MRDLRESLFRAAQLCNYSPLEEIVGQYQSKRISEEMYNVSGTEIGLPDVVTEHSGPKTIIWPYPKNTADCIDRANCADHFLRNKPNYRVVTEYGLELNQMNDSYLESLEDIIIFGSFEELINSLDIKSEYLYFKGRRITAILNELSVGYMIRKGLIEVSENLFFNTPLKTSVINGSLIALSKWQQMKIFEEVKGYLDHERYEVLPALKVNNLEELIESALQLLKDHECIVIRPFSSSQGTGISFIKREDSEVTLIENIKRALNETKNIYHRKYSTYNCFPITISPFVEAVKIQGCVTDIRIFVVYDPTDSKLHAIPGMVRRAQTPFDDYQNINISNSVTNLNAPKCNNALKGKRVYPAANDGILTEMNIDETLLASMSRTACQIWSHTLNDKKEYSIRGCFAYGSVDFIIRDSDKRYIPIEMNGSNVGSHPAVHPQFLDCFGNATTHALKYLGL